MKNYQLYFSCYHSAQSPMLIVMFWTKEPKIMLYTLKTQIMGFLLSAKDVCFHSAPDLRCKESEVFIILNDKVNAYLDYHGYYYVMYFNRKGEQVEGWVDSNRLKENNTGIGPVEK